MKVHTVLLNIDSMTEDDKKINKLNNSDIFTNLLWTTFGIIGGLNYYSKSEYLITGLMILIGVVYTYKAIRLIMDK